MDIIIEKHRLRFSKDFALLDPKKTTIIFLHDSLGCIELWKKFPEQTALRTGCNTIAYDRQGYGKSDPFVIKRRGLDYLKKEAHVLGKILEKIPEKKDIVLFGHSDGGSIALLAAALFPEKITGIITEGAHVFVEQETLNGIKAAKQAYMETSLKEKLYKYHGDKTDTVFRLWTETWLSEKFNSWNIEQYLPKIKCPSLIIQGEQDEYGTINQVKSIINNTSGESNSLIIPKTKHTPHKESPEIVIKNVISFMENIKQNKQGY